MAPYFPDAPSRDMLAHPPEEKCPMEKHMTEISERMKSCWRSFSTTLGIALIIAGLLAAAPARANPELVDPEFWKQATLEQIKGMIAEGADISIVESQYQWTPLHLAAGFAQDSSIVAELLNNGANVDAIDVDGAQPLHIAAGFNSRDGVISVLLNRGAGIEIQDNNGFTPLHWAAANATSTITASILISRGANLEAASKDGLTPLLAAANFSSSEDVLQLFYQKGGNILAKAGELDIVEILNNNEDLSATETSKQIMDQVDNATGG